MRLGKYLLCPLEDLIAALEGQIRGPRPAWPRLLLAAAAVVPCWFIYVPVHELLHVAGCVATGGEVTELQVQPMYGGTWLARIFPFVKAEGDYAGRLTGFDWHDSDLIYLATVFFPFLLTILIGVPLLLACARRRAPLALAMAVVVGLAPLSQLTGDYLEMGSILVTRPAVWSRAIDDSDARRLRSDDLFRLIDELSTAPLPRHPALVWGLVGASCAAALALAILTHYAGRLCARCYGVTPPRSASGPTDRS